MTLHFCFCDIPGFEYNLAGARSANRTVEFDYAVSDLTPLSAIGAKEHKVELLTGFMWELRKKHRLRQTFTTYPDLFLNGATVALVTYNPVTNAIATLPKGYVSFKNLFTYWYQARSRWITTDELTDAQVICTQADFMTESHDAIRILQKNTVEFETTKPY